MSYLGPLRLHFAGRFQAAVSTVNNDPAHFDNATFVPADQQLNGPNFDPPNGWWNPRGDADWRLIGCRVTSAWVGDGSAAAAGDPVLSAVVADSDRAAPAKLVDLDPCQQMVSTIWGLEMRIAGEDGNTLVRGRYEPAGFFDIWDRSARGGGDVDAGAMYQSVLKEVEWGDVNRSPFLSALREASPDGVLSVKFMVDGYNMTFGAPEFTRGRIVGTIGPGSAAEPEHMVVGRQFIAVEANPEPGNFFTPAGKINTCTAVVDEATAKIYLDLGNALPTTGSGDIAGIGALVLDVGSDALCPVSYSSGHWYAQTAGVVALPADRRLTADELARVAASPLSLRFDGSAQAAISEAPLYVRPDAFVFRCDHDDTATVRFYATHLGKPHENATVDLSADPSQLQGPPAPGVPADAIEFPPSVTTGADGVAVATIKTRDPGNVRQYLDGQVYGVRAKLADDPGEAIDPWNFVSLLVWSGFQADKPPTWLGSLQPIFQQYANLYPVMQAFLDLSSYADVCQNRNLLLLAFGLDPGNPNSMPVTRDLSSAKRLAILEWLQNPGPDGKPLMGTAPPAPREAAPAPTTNTDFAAIARGGKSAAAARRLIMSERAG
ncbi:MAG: hypothetical protein M3071_24530 [Actinomycetota bacterium]|nr:hypothetical protein [Actinomycetota bacterium]